VAQNAYLASLRDEGPMVRLGGLSCLGKLRLTGGAIRAALLRLLEYDPDLGVRRAAAMTCGQIGDTDTHIVEALRRTAQSDDSSLRKVSTGALKKLRPQT